MPLLSIHPISSVPRILRRAPPGIYSYPPPSSSIPMERVSLSPARSVRVGFLGSATEPAVVRFIAHGLSAGAVDLLHDAGATAAILVGGYACVFAFNDLTRREVLQQNLSRKLVHMLSGLLFLASWPISGTLYLC
ncbi:probable phytol kinase 1, chloroplastic [Prosopis cineraria]|uniref:probable phytol kinase 1, chloroplastic n=1 Tax=Prosopis cineraria TaxID=364024 RepID=UPI0024104CFD|nr:probable phytol kinase 1, chloroplastic [Prosopis cineraria]